MNTASGSSLVLRTAVVIALFGTASLASAADERGSLALEETPVWRPHSSALAKWPHRFLTRARLRLSAAPLPPAGGGLGDRRGNTMETLPLPGLCECSPRGR